MNFTAGIVFALSAVLGGSTPASAAKVIPLVPQPQTVEQYVQTYFADEPIMIAVAECESHFHQYATDGSVYRGKVNNLDVGVMQINEHYHSDIAAKLGLDLYTIQGNTAYAQYLYQKEGTAPWSSSEPCWSKSAAAKALDASGASNTVAISNK
ncbi:MAG TPA: transglycosylase SLT domain-containing protein [Candidatus Paceibacterota bacterium]